LGIDLERGRPGHPQDNGAHERLHRDIRLELESLGPRTSQDALDLWRQAFNEQRPHEALGLRCPSQLYHSSSRKYQGPIEEIIYPQMANRRINRHGQMSWENELYFLSTSLAGWSVGLKDTPEGRIEVWFARLLLGWIDPARASFLRADIRPQKTAKQS
jgi:hypothetical protein